MVDGAISRLSQSGRSLGRKDKGLKEISKKEERTQFPPLSLFATSSALHSFVIRFFLIFIIFKGKIFL